MELKAAFYDAERQISCLSPEGQTTSNPITQSNPQSINLALAGFYELLSKLDKLFTHLP